MKRFKQCPLTLALSRRVERGEGREEMKEIPTMWREKKF
jgi:hypothetical protein